jgi:hypothetical protein
MDNLDKHRLSIDAIHEQQLMTNVSTNATASQFFTDLTILQKPFI